MTGKLYGIGVGPGDPELMTVKAIRKLQESTVIALPAQDKESCTSYAVARQACPEIEEKKCVFLKFPMTKEPKLCKKSYAENAAVVAELLDAGETVAFLTLGDSTIYSTYIFLHEEIQKLGYDASFINGIPSFLAIASSLKIPLAIQNEAIHIIPASYGIDMEADLAGTKIMMKAGRQLKQIKQSYLSAEYFAFAQNCGMENEKLLVGREEIPEEAGYFTTVIIK